MCGAVLVLVETPETYQIIITEKFYFLSRLLHKNVFGSQRVDVKHLIEERRGGKTEFLRN